MIASGLALPARRITVNLAPTDLTKEGSHYDLPIALGLMAASAPFRTMPSTDTRCRASLGSMGRRRLQACCRRPLAPTGAAKA